MISESGGDIEDVFRDIKKDEELAEDVGLEKPSESVVQSLLVFLLFLITPVSKNHRQPPGTL